MSTFSHLPTIRSTIDTKYEQRLQHRRQGIMGFKAQADAKRSLSEKFADWMTNFFGTVFFLALNASLFLAWIIFNSGLIPGLPIFDPFPFVLLTTIVSLEAIFLAIIVLISQNRAARIADMREEIDLQINLISESEITKLMRLLAAYLQKQKIDLSHDPELQQMLEPVNPEKIEHDLEKEIS